MKTVRKSKSVAVKVERLGHGEGLPLPEYQSAGAAGLDLAAAVPARQPLRLAPKARALVPTGLVVELPQGFEAQVRPRSGLALKHGITVLNAPGTIDSDYRGEVQVLLVNLGGAPFVIRRGERIAQLVVQPVVRAALEVTVKTSATRRGKRGFGSTGTASKAGSTAKTKTGPKAAGRRKAVGARSRALVAAKLAVKRPGKAIAASRTAKKKPMPRQASPAKQASRGRARLAVRPRR